MDSCNPIYVESIGRRIMVSGLKKWPSKKKLAVF
jgi:hypothetical protein